MKPRTTILGLMGVVALMGVGLAALRSPSPLWDNALFTTVLASFSVAAVNVLFGRGGRRAFWGGSLIVGGTYFVACFGPWVRDSVRPHLVTTSALDILYPSLSVSPVQDATEWARLTRGRIEAATMRVRHANDPALLRLRTRLDGTASHALDVPSRWAAWNRPPQTLASGNPDLVAPESFLRIGHSLLTILFAGLGGLFARHRYVAHPGAES